MEEALSQDGERLVLSLQFDALLAEYKMLRDQVAFHRQMQGQLDSLALAALGLSVPLILAILERSTAALGAILLLPSLSFAVAFTQLRHERQISLDAIYVDSSLRPKVNKLLSSVSSGTASVFEFESFLARHYFARNLLVEWIATTSRGGIGLGVGIVLIGGCLYLQLILVKSPWNAYESWLLAIASVILAACLALGFYISRLHYAFYRHGGADRTR